jgi:hypothetical protein
MAWEICLTTLEDKPPTRKRTGVVEETAVACFGAGGAWMTTWPVEPPIPMADRDIVERPKEERQLSGMVLIGTAAWKLSQLIPCVRFEKLTAGGIIPCSKIKQALTSDARKAATSRWLVIPFSPYYENEVTKMSTLYSP